jgi:hypothetical protein
MTKDADQQTAKETPEEVAPASAGGWQARLREAGDIVAHNAAIILAILAVTLSFFSIYGLKASQTNLAEASSKVNELAARLASSRIAFEKYQATVVQEKTAQEEERKKLDNVLQQIIQSVSQQQAKMKISPTLEEVLHAGSAVQPAPAVTGAATAPLPTTSAATPAAGEKKAATVPEKPAKPMSPQAQSIKEAIQKLNSQ